MMEGSGSLEQQLEATKVRLIETDTFIIKIIYAKFIFMQLCYIRIFTIEKSGIFVRGF